MLFFFFVFTLFNQNLHYLRTKHCQTAELAKMAADLMIDTSVDQLGANM